MFSGPESQSTDSRRRSRSQSFPCGSDLPRYSCKLLSPLQVRLRGLLLKPQSHAKTEPTYERQRRFCRYSLDARIQVSVFREGKTIVLWGRTSEIGADGVGATLTGELTPGEVVSLELPVSVSPYLVRLRAIARYAQGLHCGFEFLAMTQEQRNTLERLCEMLTRTL